jgi:hypothetical protein
MNESRPDDAFQVIAIVPVNGSGRIFLKKKAMAHLGGDQRLRLTVGEELELAARRRGQEVPLKGGRLALPQSALQVLNASPGTLVALVAREHALALKKLVLEERPALDAHAVDYETPYRITRVIETNAMPDQLLPVLASRFQKRRLHHDVIAFLSGRRTLEAWSARRLAGRPAADDDGLRKALIAERLQAQEDDGSWGHDTMLTARRLRELSELGLTRRRAAVRRGAEWLLARAESEANPGMFFLSDRLVDRQAEILAKRKAVREGRAKGPIGALRFAGRTPSEARRILAADDLIVKSCGTRIMWPNALALEALLAVRYEGHPRVQRALESLMHGYVYWCECNYQLRAGTHVRRDIPGDKELEARERELIARYRYGGRSSLEDHLGARRVARLSREGCGVFLLGMGAHIQPCEVITTRALRHARTARVHRAAAVHLWGFAGAQHPGNGRFPEEPYCPSQAHMLQVFAGYDHPASRVAIMRSIPWIIDNQHPDGSWGEETKKDASTLAVLRGIHRIRDLLPLDFAAARKSRTR